MKLDASLDQVIQQLFQEGLHHSSGCITLDPAKARQKLAASRFEQAGAALLAVLAASSLAGASRLRVLRRGWNLRLLSDAQAPSFEELEQLIDGLFGQQQAPAWRELGLALNSLYPKHAVACSLEAKCGDQWLRGWFEKDRWQCRRMARPPDLPSPFRQQLTLRRPWLRQWWQGIDDLAILRSRTLWSPVPVEFEVARNSFASSYQLEPPSLPDQALAVLCVQSREERLRLPGYAGVDENLFHWTQPVDEPVSLCCALLPGDSSQSYLLLVHHGVTLARYQFVAPGLRVEGVVHCDQIDLDASRQHIVQNERLSALTAQVCAWIAAGCQAWMQALQRFPLSERLRLLVRDVLIQLQPGPYLQPLLSGLAGLPLLRLCDGRWTSYEQAKQASNGKGIYHYLPPVNERPPGQLEGRPVLAESDATLKLLSWLMEECLVSAADTLRPSTTIYVAQEVVPPLVDLGLCLTTLALQGAGWRAQFGLTSPYRRNLTVLEALSQWKSGEQWRGELFAHVPLSAEVQVEAEGRGFDLAVCRRELREQVSERVVELLESLHHIFAKGLPGVDSMHYCSLLCLWQSPRQGKRRCWRELPEHLLDYPLALPKKQISVGQLMANPDRYRSTALPVQHPVHRLMELLK